MLVEVLKFIRPDSSGFSFQGEMTYDNLDWIGDDKPSREEVEAGELAYQAYQESIAYRAKRKDAYPAIGDQLDAIWKMLEPPAGSEAETVKRLIGEIKAQFPKAEQF